MHLPDSGLGIWRGMSGVSGTQHKARKDMSTVTERVLFVYGHNLASLWVDLDVIGADSVDCTVQFSNLLGDRAR